MKPSTMAQARAEHRLFEITAPRFRVGHCYSAAETREEAICWATQNDKTPLHEAVFKTFRHHPTSTIGFAYLVDPKYSLGPAGQLALDPAKEDV